ncbi:hypothetical protein EU99_0984 [Prochlorococcus marinus str. MIT 9321]|uniref:Lipoprotein n=1 Tax=Prochlorococcus marinus str. MIT 9401 TaxID=167551 RepID=A0A0A2B540_PROMR|nr:hypothetical protein [Prochlorococcus marinus]KGG04054.1 hypothetical protein EU99_0984 [Prochlorococcus marinus str. MIT 9321]KGG04858.1 hypothetical protein EV00_1891 [Prochlorococcus marinus str. MIT 9322]KGG07724.1 hypothetical protein EV01_1000 [Prochlorococcus marinus str. MIT 9401]
MIFKKKEFFLLIFLILLQSCSGGRIGNFLESSFNDLEKSKEEDLQKNLLNKKILVEENKEIDDKKNNKIKKLEKPKNVLKNKKDINLKIEKKEIDYKKNNKIKKVENSKNVLENKKDINLEKIPKQKNNKIKNSSKKRKNELQSYKIIFILKDVDPKDPTEELSSILSKSEVNFEIEKIERILDSKNKSMKKIN